VAQPTAPRSGKLDVMTLSEWSAAHPEVVLRARERWSNCTVEEWADGANGSDFVCHHSSESLADAHHRARGQVCQGVEARTCGMVMSLGYATDDTRRSRIT
jgi:hypothetical protein